MGTALIYHISRHEFRLRDFKDRPAFEPRTILDPRMAYRRRAWIIELASESPLAWLKPTFERPSDRVDQRRFMADDRRPVPPQVAASVKDC